MLYTFPGYGYADYCLCQMCPYLFSGGHVQSHRVLVVCLPDQSGARVLGPEHMYAPDSPFWYSTVYTLWLSTGDEVDEKTSQADLRSQIARNDFDEVVVTGNYMTELAADVISMANRSTAVVTNQTALNSDAHMRVRALTRSRLSLVAG